MRRAAFLSGLIAAALAALPAALRFESGLVWQAFAVCMAGCALVMAPLSAALAAATTASRMRSALTVGILLATLPLLPFATLLKTTTHHRPLGGVTFAVIAGLLIIGLSLVCSRFVTWAGVQPPRQSAFARLSLLVLAALGTAALLLGLVQGLTGGSAYQTGFYDALRVLGLTTLAARVRFPETVLRRVGGLGLAAWVAVVTVGVCLGRAPVLQVELTSRCPVLHWPLVWLGG
ncbi:MAG TPA: hypothetical protein VJV79_03180 [Polyangiaceae bacterium]|nr:hypothetical protein [Polyangiaceae bacterium]